MVWKEQVTKRYKVPYTLRSSFTMDILKTYSMLTDIMATICDRVLEELSVFQDNPITQPDIQKPALSLFEITLQIPYASMVSNIRVSFCPFYSSRLQLKHPVTRSYKDRMCAATYSPVFSPLSLFSQ